MKKLIFVFIIYIFSFSLAKEQISEWPSSTLNFGNEQIYLPITVKSATTSIKYEGVKVDSENINHLKFLTPQLSADQKTEVPVILLRNFRGEESLLEEIRLAGYQLKQVKPEQKKMKNGVLYYWITPTKGSAEYYYLQNPSNISMAIKIGPMATLIAKDVDFDWNKVRWLQAGH